MECPARASEPPATGGGVEAGVGPPCPSCAEDDLDQLVWQNDEQGEHVTCHSCGFCWNPNHGRAPDR
jgi:hypothetical protein